MEARIFATKLVVFDKDKEKENSLLHTDRSTHSVMLYSKRNDTLNFYSKFTQSFFYGVHFMGTSFQPITSVWDVAERFLGTVLMRYTCMLGQRLNLFYIIMMSFYYVFTIGESAFSSWIFTNDCPIFFSVSFSFSFRTLQEIITAQT